MMSNQSMTSKTMFGDRSLLLSVVIALREDFLVVVADLFFVESLWRLLLYRCRLLSHSNNKPHNIDQWQTSIHRWRRDEFVLDVIFRLWHCVGTPSIDVELYIGLTVFILHMLPACNVVWKVIGIDVEKRETLASARIVIKSLLFF